MITSTKELRAYLELFKTQKDACEHLGVDEATLSKLQKDNYNVSASVISKILTATGFEFEKAFEVKE